MRNFIENILNNYTSAKQRLFAGHPMGSYFRDDIPEIIYNTGIVDKKEYLITGSVGKGNWAIVPWVCIFDRRITTSATKGVYIVYLLSRDGKTLYLTFNQGCTDLRNKYGKKEAIKVMRDNASEIASNISSRGFSTDEKINLGDGLTELGELYQRGTIFYKAYNRDNIPSEEEIRDDLQKMMDIYKEYYDWKYQNTLISNDNNLEKRAWLLTWNPNNFIWGDYVDNILATRYGKKVSDSWSCNSTQIKQGDRIYLTVLGTKDSNGIVASGYATGIPYEEDHWDEYKASQGQKARYVDIEFDWILNYETEDILKQRSLKELFPDQHWSPQGSGISIKSEYVDALEKEWIKYTKLKNHKFGSFDSWDIIDEETAVKHCDKSFFEHKGSGVPREICWFFGADDIGQGETKQITFIYEGQAYNARVSNESSDRRRVRIFWYSDLSKQFNNYYSLDTLAEFKRIAEDLYTITIKVGEAQMTIKDKIAAIKAYIASQGFSYEGDLIENFYLSLKSKPFVILAGTSGTGKTRLVKLFAKAIGAKLKVVPVRPDWSDSSDLFGHNDLSGQFNPGAIIDFIKEAEKDSSNPYFLCLDEMNLARVEYYLSDFLSIIETREFNDNGAIVTDPLVDETYYQRDDAKAKYGKVYIPENLYIVGTVNMDETTFPFSKKVLDRANTIEFSLVNLKSRATSNGQATEQQLDNSFLKSEYLYLRDCDDDDLVDEVCSELESFNQILAMANLHVGYRVRDEICFYMMNNKNAGLVTFDAAFDHEIMQKILPRIQGSSSAIKDVLAEMFVKCAGDYSGFTGSTDYEQMNAYIDSKDCKYPNSAKKIAFMMRRYIEDGFTSYWL